MKKKVAAIYALIILICIAIYLRLNRSDPRIAYEQFLNSHPFHKALFEFNEDNTRGERRADRPDLAKLQDFLRTMDPNTQRPTPLVLLGINKTTAALRDNVNRTIARSPSIGSSSATTFSLASGTTWTERGPKQVGGRTRAFMFDPNDPSAKKAWAGGVSGGLWYNLDVTNSNSPWTKVDDFWDNLAVSAIAVDPNNSQVFYVATGEFEWVLRGGGIWKTMDGGMNWSRLTSTENYLEIRDVVVRNEAGVSVVYAAVWPGYGGDSPPYEAGLFRSADGGNTWDQVLPYAQGSTQYTNLPTNIEIGPDNSIYVGAAAHPQVASAKSTIYTSSTGLAGSWSATSTFTANQLSFDGQVQLAIAPSNGSIIYAAIEQDEAIGGIFKSVDAGTTWSSLPLPVAADLGIPADDFTRFQAWYDLVLAVKPTDPNTCVIGGIDLYQTTDGGTSWIQISKWSNNPNMEFLPCSIVHADQHGVVFRPGFPNEIVATTDGGIFYCKSLSTASLADVFSETNLSYNVTQFYTAALHPTTANFMMAGAQDNGTQRFSSSGFGSTVDVYGGDGGMCFIDQLNPQIQIVSYTYNNVGLSTDGGNSFPITLLSDDNTGNFINAGEYDSHSKVLYTARSKTAVYRVRNVASLRQVDSVKIGLGTLASALSVSPFATSTSNLYVGTEAGRLFQVLSASSSSPVIQEITGSNFPNGTISCISFGASESQMLVTFFNYGVVNVWETRDGGVTWSNREGNLPNMPVRFAAYNPQNFDQVYLATELGVWSTDDISAASPTWGSTNGGLANVRTDVLRVRSRDGTLMASTFGRGVFTATIPAAVPQILTFDPISTKFYGDPNFNVNAQSNSGLPISSYSSSDPSIISIQGSTATINGVGTVLITAQQNGSNYNLPGSASISVTVNKGNQTISFAPLADKGIGDAPFLISAKSSRKLGTSLTSSDTTVIKLRGDSAIIVGYGFSKITATQQGNAFYVAATPVSQIQRIKRNQTILFDPIADVTLGDKPILLKATSSSGLPIQFSSDSPGISVKNDSISLLQAGHVQINADQPGDTNFFAASTAQQTFCIKPAKPTITIVKINDSTAVLASSASTGNQWFKNNTVLPDSTNSTLLVKISAAYTVQTTVDNCVSELSDPKIFTVLGTVPSSDPNMTLYPNPSRSNITVQLAGASPGKIKISIFDSTGNLLEQKIAQNSGSVDLDISNFPVGLYIILVEDGSRTYQQKFVRQ